MTSRKIGDVLPHLRRLVIASEATDQQLLERFLAGRDEAAFSALVCRHGPMVLGVCRRVLSNPHDAEDAFQTTFLLLVSKAGSLSQPERLGSWLYGVAQRTALKLRGQIACRSRQEQPLVDVVAREEVVELVWQELRPMLDEELQRLPENYRVPVVLCCLEGVSKRAAARQLGWPEGTLSTRLHHARRLLRQRLRRRGLTLSAGVVALVLSEGMAPGAVSASLTTATVTAACILAARGTMTGLPATVAALTEGVLRAMFMSKVKVVAIALVVAGFLTLGISGAIRDLRAEPQQAVTTGNGPQPRINATLPPSALLVSDADEKPTTTQQDESTNRSGAPFVGLYSIQKLATNKQVLQELKIDEAAAKKIKDAIDKIREDNKNDIVKLRKRNIPQKDRVVIEKKLNDAYTKAVTDSLNADQMKRLRQIARGLQGVSAFQLEDVQTALKLKQEQKSKLKGIHDKAEKDIHDLAVADEQDSFKYNAVLQTARTASLNALTEDQKKVFQELIGKPFKFR